MFSQRGVAGAAKIGLKLEQSFTSQNICTRLISTKEVIDRESKYAAHNYHPLPVALTKGQGKCIIVFSIFPFDKFMKYS